MTRRRIGQRERDAIAAEHRSWLGTIIINAAVGAFLGCIIALAIIYFDIADIGTMLAASDRKWAYGALFLFGFSQLFAMVVCGSGIWLRAVSERDD